MPLRRLSTAILAAAVLAVGATAAQAVVPKGTYSGKFSDGGTAKLTVKSDKLLKVYRKSLKFTCSDGDTFKSLASTATGDVDVSSKKFSIADTTTADAVTWEMTGTFSVKKRKVKGQYKETRRFNEQNELDENGSITCQTGNLTYSAKLPPKR